MPIKTLHLTNAYHATSGGIRTFYRALLKAANEAARPLSLVVPGERTMVETIGEWGRIYHLAAPRSPAFDQRYRLLLPHTYLWPVRSAIQRIIRAEQPDLIEVCDKYALAWLGGLLRRGWMPGVKRPVLIGLSCERMDDSVAAWLGESVLVRRVTQLYLGHLYIGQFDAHIANSPYTAAELSTAMTPRHKRLICVQPMGVAVDDFSPTRRTLARRAALCQRVGLSEHSRLLLYVGRLSAEKNLSLLVRLMEQLMKEPWSNYRLIVAGAGPLGEAFARECEDCVPRRVRFLGQIENHTELADLYANCDVFVHPNPREPFGLAPLEAMAAGLPLVAPNTGGILSYADHTNAWLAEPTAAAFAAAVRSVFANDEQRAARLAAARTTAEEHAWEKIAASFFRLYEALHKELKNGRQEVAGHLSLPMMEMRAER